MRTRFLGLTLLALAMLALTGCTQYAFGGNQSEVETIDGTTITRTLQYLDDNTAGPLYELTFTVPDGWVDEFQTLNRGNSLVFRYITEDEDDADADDDDEDREPAGSLIFTIDALSNAQYWEQIGSYPGQYKNITNTADTYFIYNLPIDAYYSGLADEEFDELAADVPAVIQSVEWVRVAD